MKCITKRIATNLITFAVTATLLLLTSCGQEEYRIGVSQCYHNSWNAKLVSDLQREANTHPELILDVAQSTDVQSQIADINRFIDEGVDAIIISPEDAEAVVPVTDRAYDKGIPVISVDSEVASGKYAAIVSVDNYDVGVRGGRYAAISLGGHGKVICVLGRQGSTATHNRHRGFSDAIRNFPDIQIVDSCYADWTYESALPLLDSLFRLHPDVDFIAAQSDAMALAAYDAWAKTGSDRKLTIIGVDALFGEGNGIEAVQQGKLAASCINPTGGQEAIQLAWDIINGHPYEREIQLQTQMVDPSNLHLISLQQQRIDRLSNSLEMVNGRLGLYFQRSRLLQYLVIAIVLIVLIGMAFIIYVIRSHRRVLALQNKEKISTLAKLNFFTNVSHSFRTPLTLIADPIRVMNEEGGLTDRQKKLLDLMSKNTDQLLGLTNQVLSVLQADLLNDGAQLDAVAQQSVTNTQSAQAFRNKQFGAHPDLVSDESRKTLLIIDDNADVRNYLTMLLSEGYLVLTAPNGEEGLHMAQQNIPDLIICDVMMPVMDGLECCRLIKADQSTSHIPVLLLTAYALDDQRIQGYRSGADAYITKPFNVDVLKARIANLISSRKHIDASNDRHTEMEKVEMGVIDRGFVNHFHSFIVENMSNADLDVQQVSNEFNMSRVQLYRKCKSLTGQSPVELIRVIRLKAAKQMLLTTDLSVSEVAYEVGFSSPSYFAKCYKDQFNMSPTDVQKSVRQ